MSRNIAIVAGVIALALAGGAGWFFSQGDAEPTTDVSAPEIDPGGDAESGDGSDSSDAGPKTLELTDASSATFILDEELRGTPTTVVASSAIVLGQIQIDTTDLAASQVGKILVNARSFESDASLRNRAIRGPILDTDTFEFIEFEPTSISGLSGAATVGEELTFTIVGTLTIRDISSDVEFAVSATLVDDSTIEGFASTTVSRTAYELVIPSVPTVANVSDEVTLELAFVAEG